MTFSLQSSASIQFRTDPPSLCYLPNLDPAMAKDQFEMGPLPARRCHTCTENSQLRRNLWAGQWIVQRSTKCSLCQSRCSELQKKLCSQRAEPTPTHLHVPSRDQCARLWLFRSSPVSLKSPAKRTCASRYCNFSTSICSISDIQKPCESKFPHSLEGNLWKLRAEHLIGKQVTLCSRPRALCGSLERMSGYPICLSKCLKRPESTQKDVTTTSDTV